MSTARQRRMERRRTVRANAAKRAGRNVVIPTKAIITAAAANEPTKVPRIDIVAYNGGELLVDGFELPVVIDFAGAIIPPTLPLNVDHVQEVTHLLGQGRTELANNSLSIHGTITASNANAAEVVRLAKSGFQWQASIKAIVTDSRVIPSGQAVDINGRTFTGPIIHATSSQLTHCAVLGEGADQTSSVTIAARAAQALKGSSIMSFEDYVASLGLDAATLTPEATAALQAAFTAAYPPSAGDPADDVMSAESASMDDEEKKRQDQAAAAARATAARASSRQAHHTLPNVLAASRKQEADEIRRVATIRAKAKDFPLIAAKAVEEGWSADKVELEVMKANRPTGPSHRTPMAPEMPLVIEAAFATARKIKGIEKHYSDQVLQAAHTQFRGRIGLQQMILIAAAANGYQVGIGSRISMGNIRTVLQHAFPQTLEAAGFSTVSLPGIFSNVANKDLLDGYMEEDQTWREVGGIKSVNDFKVATSYRMLDNMEYEELGPGGEIKHGTVGEESYTRQAKTYAKMFALTRTSIVNDDLGAFDDLKSRVGRGAATKLNRIFWARWLNNSTFFTSARGNYITGATTTLEVDCVGLQLALNAFDALRTPAADGSKVPGGLVGGSPTILLTPGGGIASNAEVIYKNTNLGAVGNSTANNFSGRYRPVKSVFLNDSSISNYSATGWYLLRDPKSAPGVVVSFLDGVETPTVESADADFNTLGIQFRGYHDFGVDQAEYLCGVKSKGAA